VKRPLFGFLKDKIAKAVSKLSAKKEPDSKIERSKEDKPKIKVATKIKKALLGKVQLSDEEIDSFAWDFEMSLLESDVSMDSAQKLSNDLKERLKTTEFRGKDFAQAVKEQIKEVLVKDIVQDDLDLLKKAKEKHPFIIMFLGPNGAGKTTTIAKITSLFLKNGKTVVLSASDTFRSGAIKQLEHHADKLGVKMIKHDYGADPAAVAYDAIESAKAKGIDVVLIDTAGRQHTNLNLMQELQKIKRVSKPDCQIFVGEAQAGQSLIDQIEKFHDELGVDGVILTKIDTDAKGGGAISIITKLHLPILYVGTGQNYEDLEKFTPAFIIDKII